MPPQAQRPKTLQANHKKQPEPASKHKHQHTKSKRVRSTSPIQATTQATSFPTSPEASTPAPSRRSQPSAELSARGTPRRRAALQADVSRRSARKKKTQLEWSEDSEDERASQPSSPPRSTTRDAGQELVIASSNESSDLSNVDPTASRSKPQRPHGKSRQLSNCQVPRAASETTTAALEGDAAEMGIELPMTVAVPDRRQEIAKRTGQKAKAPDVFKA